MKNDQKGNEGRQQKDTSIGNKQGTTQTSAQNNGGTNREVQNDQYTKDLRQSGDRSSSGNDERRK